MASLDWSQCPVVESIPGKVSGDLLDAAETAGFDVLLTTHFLTDQRLKSFFSL